MSHRRTRFFWWAVCDIAQISTHGSIAFRIGGPPCCSTLATSSARPDGQAHPATDERTARTVAADCPGSLVPVHIPIGGIKCPAGGTVVASAGREWRPKGACRGPFRDWHGSCKHRPRGFTCVRPLAPGIRRGGRRVEETCWVGLGEKSRGVCDDRGSKNRRRDLRSSPGRRGSHDALDDARFSP